MDMWDLAELSENLCFSEKKNDHLRILKMVPLCQASKHHPTPKMSEPYIEQKIFYSQNNFIISGFRSFYHFSRFLGGWTSFFWYITSLGDSLSEMYHSFFLKSTEIFSSDVANDSAICYIHCTTVSLAFKCPQTPKIFLGRFAAKEMCCETRGGFLLGTPLMIKTRSTMSM